MLMDPLDRHENPLVLEREQPGASKAPARRFESRETVDKPLFSHAFFALLAIGVGTYLGRMQETINPAPNTEEDTDKSQVAADQQNEKLAMLAAPDAGALAEELAAFWKKFIDDYRQADGMTPRLVRQHFLSSDLRPIDYTSDDGYRGQTSRPFRIDDRANSFNFSPQDFGKLKFGFQMAAQNGASPASAGVPAGSTPEAPGASKGLDGTGSGNGNNGGGGGGGGGGGADKLNRAPVSTGPLYLGTGLANLSILLTWADLARAATDPDGDRLALSNIETASGTIRAYGTDAWIFTPTRDMVGLVSFRYSISDGLGSVTGSAWLTINQQPEREIVGTAGDDVLVGTPSKDIILAGAGDDIVYGREADDTIFGDDGDDLLLGGDGADVIHGGHGNDRIFGGSGNDVILAGWGNDIVFAEDGQDSVQGGTGDDILSGGEGNDRLFGDDDNDVLSGDAGDDVLDGGSGHDTLAGGSGHDALLGADGDDVFVAGTAPVLSHDMASAINGSDTATSAESDGDDTIYGGAGIDTYDASAARDSVTINLAQHEATGAEIGMDRVFEVENATAGSGADVLVGDRSANILVGRAGNDDITGGGGNDQLSGGTGDDLFRAAGIGSETNSGHDGDDQIDGGDGCDTYDASQASSSVDIDLGAGVAEGDDIGTDVLVSVENATGGSGNDRLSASNAVNILIGNDGDDVFVFSAASHLSNSGSGRDEIHDFEIGDKIDFSKLGRELGRLHFADGDTLVTELDDKDHKTLIKLFREMTEDGEDVQVVQLITDLDDDDHYELIVISHNPLNSSDFILTASGLPDGQVA